MIRFFESLGQSVIAILDYIGGLALLLWEALGYILAGGLRWSLAIYQMAFLGVNSIMIVLLTTTFAGMVISLQLAHVAVTYGVSNIVGGGVALAMARELGPMLTAVVVAGRAGSAITAEIGSMKVTEQIDALICMAVSPIKFLVCPRIVALVLMMPLLTLFSDMAGLVGGAFVADASAGIPQEVFYDSVRRMTELDDVVKGLGKSMIYGMQIALVSCQQGLQSGRGAAGVGQATTGSVVISMIIIFTTNYFLSAWLYPIN
ncbi:ABC transporter permease [bacterium]|nr:ABC transporter permease [bacterium]